MKPKTEHVETQECSVGALELYRDKTGQWRWRVLRKGRILADSGQGYRRRCDMIRGLCSANEVLINLTWRAIERK